MQTLERPKEEQILINVTDNAYEDDSFDDDAELRKLEENPEYAKNHPLNVDNWTTDEIIASIKEGIRDAEEGRCMTFEEFQQYFHDKYGYAKII